MAVAELGDAGGVGLGARRDQDREVERGGAVEQAGQDAEAGGVGPVEILEHQPRAPSGQAFEQTVGDDLGEIGRAVSLAVDSARNGWNGSAWRNGSQRTRSTDAPDRSASPMTVAARWDLPIPAPPSITWKAGGGVAAIVAAIPVRSSIDWCRDPVTISPHLRSTGRRRLYRRPHPPRQGGSLPGRPTAPVVRVASSVL